MHLGRAKVGREGQAAARLATTTSQPIREVHYYAARLATTTSEPIRDLHHYAARLVIKTSQPTRDLHYNAAWLGTLHNYAISDLRNYARDKNQPTNQKLGQLSTEDSDNN